MNIDDCSSPETVCLQCGDKGFSNAFVYCIKCLQFAVHRYCLTVLPKSADEFVRWVCDDCEMKVIECRPCSNSLKKKKLSIDNMTLEDQINRANLNTCEPLALIPKDIIAGSTNVLSSNAALHKIEQSTLPKYESKIKAQKKRVLKKRRDQDDEIMKMRSLNARKSNVIKRLQRDVARESTAKDELMREMERLKEEQAEALAVARLEGAKAFKASLAFQECVVMRALDLYEHGFNVCLAQAKHARAFRKGFDASLLDPCKDEKLRPRTEVEDEPKIEAEFAELLD